MSKKVRIAKICLDIDGKKIELTLKQAQQLKDVLNETFGEEVTEYVYPHHHHHNHYPYWTYTSSPTIAPQPFLGTTITCGNVAEAISSDTANVSANSAGTLTLALQ